MKLTTLTHAQSLIASGMSCLAVSRQLGLSNATLARRLKRLAECEGDVEAALESKPTGRPVAFSPDEFETRLARWYRCAKESLPVAAYFFARDERVRPEICEVIFAIEERALASGKDEHWPDSVRRAFRVTAQELAEFRGKKHAQQEEMVTRRGMFELLEGGARREILPGECWELDDYSSNQPYVFKDPATGEYYIGRQVLACRDLCAARWLAFDHIGRERDAYRGEDVLRYIHRLVMAWGKPRRLRLERGTWESSAVHGIEVPGMVKRWGDLRDILLIEHVFKSKSKAIIEGGFNVLQRWLGHTGTDIGRVRGEFEEATKRLRQAQSTRADPLTLGFLTQEASSLAHHEAAVIINGRPMFREHLQEKVSPEDLVSRLGWHTTPLLESEAWYFRPYKVLRTVRAGTVNVSPGNGWQKLYFKLNGVREGVHFENGHQVLLAYDPALPELGAWVCNGDKSARNRENWKMGQVLLTAAPEMGLAPQFNASGVLSPHMPVRKKASAAAATTFRAIKAAAGLTQPSGSREAVAMNGKGGVATASDLPRPETAAPAAVVGPVPESVRANPLRMPAPATSSRHSPVDKAAEIRRLQAALMED
jgi:hypothetical protein